VFIDPLSTPTLSFDPQVHGIMVDRNAQVTGRPPETPISDGRFYNYLPHMAKSPPSVTKL
jgi:hypothetical protein